MFAAQPVRSTPMLRYTMLFALFAIVVLSVQSHHFATGNFRDDEIYVIHGVLDKSLADVTDWMAGGGVHPPGWLYAANIWTKLFGTAEPVTRILSKLFTLFTLAFICRLGADLFDKRVGLLSLLTLGALPFFLFYSVELRPYPALVMCVVAALFFFMRWLRKPNFRYALLYVLAGILGLYTHFFMVYVIAAQAIFLLIFVRWNRGLYLRAIGLFAAVGLSFLGWLLPFLHSTLVVRAGGVYYAYKSTWNGLYKAQRDLMVGHTFFYQALVAASLVIPTGYLRWDRSDNTRFRFGYAWRKGYLVVYVVAVLGVAFTINAVVRNVSDRNLIIVLPAVALLAALAIRRFHWLIQIGLVILLALPSLTLTDRLYRNGPYQEMVRFMAETYQPNSRIIMDASPANGVVVPATYYLLDYLPGDPKMTDFWHPVEAANLPLSKYWSEDLVNIVTDADPDTFQRFEAFLDGAEQVWYIRIRQDMTSFGDVYRDYLDAHYVPVRRGEWGWPYNDTHVVTEYRAVDDSLPDMYRFGDSIGLQRWELVGDATVSACDTLNMESLWRTHDPLTTGYSMTLALIGDAGSIANTDGPPGGLQTELWLPEKLYLDNRAVTVPCDLAPGEYELVYGVYDLATIQNLPVTDASGADVGALLPLVTITVQ